MNRTEVTRILAALTDEEFNNLVAEARPPVEHGGRARGRAAYAKGGHQRLTTIDVEPEPTTDDTAAIQKGQR
ncbi:Uncharacterised protein [Mycolicibacterium flavescens]|uniref:hypothetical protein n=1 Tax=Mycobacterium neumannii TaxID=2048551 RepID=UPI000B943BE6|nr:hypothetical protein [Mycobacterium neumannii]VEG42728.1 Uncharacterised protein [Mycolicibacterium flavescens]